MIKSIILGMLLFLFGGCANTNVNSSVDTRSLPTRCGEYDVHYGVPQGFEKRMVR